MAREAIVARVRRGGIRTALLVLGIVLISANLRPAITVVGPLVEMIRLDTGFSAATAGLLTTLPVLAFGFGAWVAAALARRLGIEKALFVSVLVLAAGIGVRVTAGTVPLFAGTLVLGTGIAVANVLLPALVKRDFPGRLGAMTALYSGLLGGMGAVGSGVAVPLADDLSLGWEGALGIWALPALAAAIVWIPQLSGETRGEVAEPVAAPGDAWRSRLGWMVTLFFGVQAFGFYVTIAWLPPILIGEGLTEGRAGLMLFLVQASGLVAMLTVPQAADRAADQRTLVGLMGALMLGGITGLLIAGSTAVELWVVMLGLAQGAGLALALMFFVLRSRDSHQASELSGMAQGVGYTIAATGPVLAGLMHDATDGWTIVLAMLLVMAAILLLTGLRAARAEVIADRGG